MCSVTSGKSQDEDWPELQKLVDEFVYPYEAGIPNDSVGVGEYILQSWGGKYGSRLWYKSSEVDSMIIDVFGLDYKEDGPIAGVIEPVSDNTLIRKSMLPRATWETGMPPGEWMLQILNGCLPSSRLMIRSFHLILLGITEKIILLLLPLPIQTSLLIWTMERSRFHGEFTGATPSSGSLILAREWHGHSWKRLYSKILCITCSKPEMFYKLKSYGDTMLEKDLLITVTPPERRYEQGIPAKECRSV